jgi:hypothetical protein
MHWLHRRLRDARRTVTRFCRNVWRYRRWLARDGDYDWAFLAEVMELKLGFMSAHFAEHRLDSNWEQTAADTREAAQILHRMRDDDANYTRHEEFGFLRYHEMDEVEKNVFWDACREAEEKDRKRLGELMSRLDEWWD